MKKILLLLVAVLAAASSFAATLTTPVPAAEAWTMKRDTTAFGPIYATRAECIGAAQAHADAAAKSANYSCSDIRPFRVTYIASPAPCTTQPSTNTATIACAAGLSPPWQQTTTVTVSAPPACVVSTTLSPQSAPATACQPTAPPPTGALLMSPTGTDSGDCKTTPCRTFAYAFARLAAGGELVLQDGTYGSAISWTGPAGSAQIPSGTASAYTVVRALNPGKVVVPGLFIGRSTRKDSYIKVQGITFEGGGSLYNTSFVTVKDSGFHGAFGVGTIDHNNGNTDNLIEDVWVWASEQRGIAMNYRADRNVWRRVIVRGDGCAASTCMGDGNPNIGITVYNSHDVSLQNVVVIDRLLLTGAGPYADFASAQHERFAGDTDRTGRNEWLGTMSINAPDSGYYFELDIGQVLAPTVRMQDAVAIGAAGGGFNLAREGTGNVLNNLIADVKAGNGVRIAPEMTDAGRTGTLTNVIAMGTGSLAVNSAYVANRVALSGTWGSQWNQTTPTNIFQTDAKTSGLKYPVRVEAGSALAAAGFTLDITKRIGTDGARFGDTNYNAITTAPLWPWPNEARIKAEMCASVTRGFCSARSLSAYIWERLGNAAPF